jgi:hypothetical protein
MGFLQHRQLPMQGSPISTPVLPSPLGALQWISPRWLYPIQITMVAGMPTS